MMLSHTSAKLYDSKQMNGIFLKHVVRTKGAAITVTQLWPTHNVLDVHELEDNTNYEALAVNALLNSS